MSSRNPFNKLTKDISPKRRAGIEARKIELREEMELNELRRAIGVSQEVLAEQLNVLQPAIAKLERRTDIRISSLRKMIEAMGGSLEIKAHFPQGDVTITNFTEVIGQ
ncbi:MAG: XRE family transcriptional regulator [Gammaproteobacteria bacterium]|nr:XRE family transcriptional regulator [Gammaproteobacteria bacterium]